MISFFLILGVFIGFIYATFWAIEFTDDQRRKRNDARQQANWMNARFQKLTKTKKDHDKNTDH
jgi:hypothetical protein